MLAAIIDVLPVADCGFLLVGVDLSDLVVALHVRQQCLSKAAFDCTFTMVHFAFECKQAGRKVRQIREREQIEEGSWLHSSQSPVSSFWLYSLSDWFSH